MIHPTRKKCSEIPTTGVLSLTGKREREYVKFISNGQIRKLIVPKDEPEVFPIVMCQEKFQELAERSKVLTPQEQWEELQKKEEEKEKKIAECRARKEEIKKWDTVKEKGQKLSKIDQEAERRANYTLNRAALLKAEQEDEIKAANRLILGTKCHAIRCAQIAEKALTKKELEKEERRLEEMMEQERLKLIASEERKKEEDRIRKSKYVEHIKQQIHENETQQAILAQQLEQESKLIQQGMIQSNFEALENMKKKAADQAAMRAELHAINEQILQLKKIEKEESIIADLKVQEYMRQKAEREAEREAEIQRMKQAKEKEIARLRALQERQQDLQSQKDELKSKRIQEEVEREWRRKEQELARRHAKEEAALREAREAQIHERKRMQARDIALEKQEFNRILAGQIQAAEKLRQDEENKKKKTADYRISLLAQINEKVGERVKNRQKILEEGAALALEEEKRQQRVNDVLHNKIEELKIHKVPEVYIKEIERQLKLKS
ncbi:cilia- and flagella-associated protein 45-like isoform X2 [Ischnura elegans]|nr:cilia- and flagella-associated protein 45-like isoform X2 [Ischnura elegans]XP_046385401.1 cilia- and flagella-associated protein 45-like isoform X2 [Ischnura elegans]XP_046385402.1 cilia- and flagella-associated protein 45-like isoform X2 [Ischnura elegans]